MGVKVLIVEDNCDLLENIVEYLSLEGFSVTGTGSALDFFQTLMTDDFTIAIVDIGLPDRSGFEIVEHLRVHTKLGIIILTARDAISDKMRGYESGTDYYFIKPIDSRELVASVKTLAGRLKERSTETKILPQNREWTLDSRNWILSSPGGAVLKLTTKEFSLLKTLIEASGSPVPRQELLTSLGYRDEGPYGNRAMDVLIVRLRKKIKKISPEETPIKTIHQVGYSFSTPSRIV